MPLTDTACRNAKPDTDNPKMFRLPDGNGLFLQIEANGAKLWRYRYKLPLGDGKYKEKMLSFGKYPKVTLAEAREERDKARKDVSRGVDPSVTKKKNSARAAADRELTYEAITREWHAKQKHMWSENYAKDVLDRQEQNVFPAIGKLPIKEIDSEIFLEVLRKIEKRGALDLVQRIRRKSSEIFCYAIACGIIKEDPTYTLRKSIAPHKAGSFAAFGREDFPEFLRKLDKNVARLYPVTLDAIWLIMYTFVRTNELIGARVKEFNLETNMWLIPAERMKMKLEHLVPLSHQAATIIKRRINDYKLEADDYLFPSTRPKKHISDSAILVALYRMGYKGIMTGHGFRSLMMGICKKVLGYRHEVPDRQLAHVHIDKTDRAYDREKFIEERIVMMQQLADWIDQCY